jgi:hypothetical protein
MPRKPRVDPPPLQRIEVEDADEILDVTVRDHTCIIKSAGYVNRELYSDRLWDVIMPRVVADYLDENGRKNIPPTKDYLSSPTKFANQVMKWGIHFSGDLTSLRKEYYSDVLKHVQIFENAIKAKKQS